jgi:tetratricopeptide (TPR) repeat protein
MQIKEAVDILEHLCKLLEDPDFQVALPTLVRAYLESKRFEEAVKLLELAVRIQMGRAETHPDRLSSEHELGYAYLENEQIQESIKLLEHVVKIQAITLAPRHPFRLASQHVLGQAYFRNRQIDEAVKLLEHVVRIRAITLAETPGAVVIGA